MARKTQHDKIKKVERKCGLARLQDHIEKIRLRLYGHMKRIHQL